MGLLSKTQPSKGGQGPRAGGRRRDSAGQKVKKGSEISAWPLHHVAFTASQRIIDMSVRTFVMWIHIVWLNVK